MPSIQRTAILVQPTALRQRNRQASILHGDAWGRDTSYTISCASKGTGAQGCYRTTTVCIYLRPLVVSTPHHSPTETALRLCFP